jgi:hypothetical protein
LEGAGASSAELEESAPGDTEVELDASLEGVSLWEVCATKGRHKTDEHKAIMSNAQRRNKNSDRKFTLPRSTERAEC